MVSKVKDLETFNKKFEFGENENQNENLSNSIVNHSMNITTPPKLEFKDRITSISSVSYKVSY